jgi:hypothetical protein
LDNKVGGGGSRWALLNRLLWPNWSEIRSKCLIPVIKSIFGVSPRIMTLDFFCVSRGKNQFYAQIRRFSRWCLWEAFLRKKRNVNRRRRRQNEAGEILSAREW